MGPSLEGEVMCELAPGETPRSLEVLAHVIDLLDGGNNLSIDILLGL